jgi:hypothetical protein
MLPAETGLTRMPCALGKGHKLDHGAIAANKEMRGHFHAADLAEVRVRIPVERIREQSLDFRPIELTRWETNPVDDDHGWVGTIGSGILIRAGALHRRLQQTGGFVDSE